ncbi:phage tail protein [Propionibacteriaceae bacterium Y2011]|uniref:phage tail protein n=1 Tax=Microlunatus sp. Y2014 TaxID=3418488 RepID=UPI003B4D4283
MPDLTTTFKFALEIDGVNLGFFRKCAGIESETEVIEYKEATKDGRMIIRKVPGAMKWGDITLDRRTDSSLALWEWRKQVIDGDVDSARRNGSIVAYDSKSAEVARWNFEAGWPSKWSGADFDAGANEVATESVTITHEGIVRS